MLKKLQNLLFEDDDDDYIDDEDEEEVSSPVKVASPVNIPPQKPVRKEPVSMPSDPVMDTPRMEEPKKMSRIDVTTEVPVQAAPAIKKEEKKPAKPLGITVDEEVKKAPVKPKVVKPTKPKTQKPSKPAPSKRGYEFKPVISPIFGVDEKDLTALKTTTKKVEAMEEEAEDDSNITPVLSPIYGSTMKEVNPSAPVKTEKKKEEKKATVKESKPQAEEEVPEFSLDDILKVRDEEYDNSDLGNTAPLFPDLNLPDDPEDLKEEPDQTQVFNKPLTK